VQHSRQRRHAAGRRRHRDEVEHVTR
jgi:hypothetical protein